MWTTTTTPSFTPNEEGRLAALRRYRILDTLPEPALDELTSLAAQICEVPISLISLVDENRQWFKSRFGMEAAETPRELSFCAHALCQAEPLIVPDTTQDPRFSNNPQVTGEAGLRFYAGAPLVTRDGDVLGTLCVIDREPRTLRPEQERALRILSRQVMTHIEMRCQARELAEDDRLLRAIFDAERACVKLLTADGKITMINRAGLQIMEADSLKQIDGQCLFRLVGEKQRAQFLDLTERVFRGESGALEFEFTGLKGTRRQLAIRAEPLRDEQGAVCAMLAITRDLTERRRSEAQLDLLETCVERLNDIVFITEGGPSDGPGARIVFVNQAFTRISGYAQEEVLGRSPQFLEGPNTSRAELDRIRVALQEQKPVRVELIHYTKSGEEYWVELDIAPAIDAEGRQTHSVAIAREITERKKHEEQTLRTQRLDIIGTLAGGIAHDLNNMLGPIVTSIELLKMQFPDPASQELLAIIAGNARRGANMVRQVLSFARGVEGQRVEVQIKHVFKEIEQIVRDTFLKNIEIRTMIPNDLLVILGDPTQLYQVILNLCLNARDAMPEGGTLTLAAENVVVDAQYAGSLPEARPGRYVVVRVEDTGSGIPPEILERIFDPFFTTKLVGRGTGLGLSTSLGIVRSHGGFMQVSSRHGKGATFRVYLPAAVASPPAPNKAEVAAKLREGRGELILVVDDEASVRAISKRTLEAFGYRAEVAADGTEALAIYAQQSAEIGAVVTDMNMPVMDGQATIRVLRKMNPSLPIVAASGLASQPEVANLGVKYFLPKPYTTAELLDVLARVFARGT